MFATAHPWSYLVLNFYLLRVFKILFNFNTSYWSSYFLFLPGSILGDCTVLRICPFLQGSHFICIWFFIIVSCDPLYFCCVGCNFSLFISDFIDLGPLTFFFSLMSLAKGLSVLFIFSKNQLLLSLIFAVVFFSLCLIYFCSDVCNFFPSTNFGFCLFFL